MDVRDVSVHRTNHQWLPQPPNQSAPVGCHARVHIDSWLIDLRARDQLSRRIPLGELLVDWVNQSRALANGTGDVLHLSDAFAGIQVADAFAGIQVASLVTSRAMGSRHAVGKSSEKVWGGAGGG